MKHPPFILDIGEALDALRLDNTADNLDIVYNLLDAVPGYLAHTVGLAPPYSPLAKTAAKFILQQWYYGESADADKYQRIIDSLLKALSAERKKQK